MNCPNCGASLASAKRDGVEMDSCPSCKGMWLSRQELEQLEDKTFDLGDDGKGTLIFSSEASSRLCPQCAKPMRTFEYRDYDLELDFCADGHGFWLDDGENKRVMALMKQEESSLSRKYSAEERWGGQLQRWRTGSFLTKIMDHFR